MRHRQGRYRLSRSIGPRARIANEEFTVRPARIPPFFHGTDAANHQGKCEDGPNSGFHDSFPRLSSGRWIKILPPPPSLAPPPSRVVRRPLRGGLRTAWRGVSQTARPRVSLGPPARSRRLARGGGLGLPPLESAPRACLALLAGEDRRFRRKGGAGAPREVRSARSAGDLHRGAAPHLARPLFPPARLEPARPPRPDLSRPARARVEDQDPEAATLFAFVGKEGLYAGMQSPRLSNGFFPGGSRYLAQDEPETISRAGAKIAEALHYLRLHCPVPPPGAHWLELGACPGGMTSELLARGQRVTAIDRAPLDPRLDGRAGLTFVLGDATPLHSARRAALRRAPLRHERSRGRVDRRGHAPFGVCQGRGPRRLHPEAPARRVGFRAARTPRPHRRHGAACRPAPLREDAPHLQPARIHPVFRTRPCPEK